jgi:hypothetical protein
MPVRYYPTSRIIANQLTRGAQLSKNGIPYVGLYYKTFDNKFYSGPNPVVGPNELLDDINSNIGLSGNDINRVINSENPKSHNNFTLSNLQQSRVPKSITSYFPKPIKTDYDLGYINRYFVKKKNDNGYITEISPSVFTSIVNGDPGYDTNMLQTQVIAWKLTGPLRSIRISQYDTKAGIYDTNERLVKAANPNFFGLIEYIGGQYDKFGIPT